MLLASYAEEPLHAVSGTATSDRVNTYSL